jgi:4-azaleucine resistance transporter AzlC
LLPPSASVEGPASFNIRSNGPARAAVTPKSSSFQARSYTGAVPEGEERSEFLAGVRAELPLLLGVAPFGMAYGAYAIERGLSSPLAMAMSSIVFGGASQLVAARLISGGEAGVVVVLAVWLVNLRHMLYSASLAPFAGRLPLRWRAGLAYLLTDEAFAVDIVRYHRGPASNGHWFALGAGIALWLTWQVTTGIGVAAGSTVPESWELDFALPLTFIALIIPAMRERAALASALVAAALATAGYHWPYSTGLFSAAVAGIAAGLVLERATSSGQARAGQAAA